MAGTEPALWHLAQAHGWRQFWLFGMDGDEAKVVHDRQYPDCPVEVIPRAPG